MSGLRLAIGGCHYEQIKGHLFPDDGFEAAVIIICGRAGKKYCVQQVIEIPYDRCVNRASDRLTWPGAYLDDALELADPIDASIILMHSHPGGTLDFSEMDNASDAVTIPCLFHGMSNASVMHGSAIMVPDGSVRVRLYDVDMVEKRMTEAAACGADILSLAHHQISRPIPFSNEMTASLNGLTACVVGVSGTGSIVAETLARLGIGKLILIDFDKVEIKNLNRILNSIYQDAITQIDKTEMMKNAILKHHPSITIVTLNKSICEPESITASSEADVIFCCVDTIEGRYFCDMISSAFIIPLIDMGVTIPTRVDKDGLRVIADVCGRIDYVFPGGASLGDRGIWTPEGLHREYLQTVAPEALEAQIEAGYIKGIPEEAPSVISLNMRAASTAVNEWIFRLFHVRHEQNDLYASTYFSLASGDEEFEAESNHNKTLNAILGRGLRSPLLGLPNLIVESEKTA